LANTSDTLADVGDGDTCISSVFLTVGDNDMRVRLTRKLSERINGIDLRGRAVGM